MSMLKKWNSMFASEEDELYMEEGSPFYSNSETSENRVTKKAAKKSAAVYAKNTVRKGDVILVEPLVFADCKDIIDNIRANKVLILNLTKLDLQTSDRLLDFISGGIYALDAKLKTIGDEIYLCVPKGVEVAGEFTGGEF
ncbi:MULTISPECIES: cell division protein SepF [unclassified Gemella]|uniref:cell division protein SepF n=1 Tax=unclassified Gemella TaxID=2624949 RepID=UPI00107429A3|nr:MULTISPECIES: cell division protein SepF [unclassified Gemella]MBF0710538.1 cell division protein SepF [Gemella sp. GL1.1]MBF0747215.1 cell division protein SepF [Gemella sp. 19428wG2_WT2a]NYS27882.1 cell division protein SepF [Gemella sp. GL1]TFU58010.1 DUF552 domain-containing protein [Gemella sp. WT2a]